MNKFEKRNKKLNQSINSGQILDIFEKVANDMDLERTDKFSEKIISYNPEELSDFEFDFNDGKSTDDQVNHKLYENIRRKRLETYLYKGSNRLFFIRSEYDKEPEGRIHQLSTLSN